MAGLSEYNKKRNFKSTSEPAGKKNVKSSAKLKFVVQRHHASRLHYDFRLELDGTLKSWAVPKGPSLNPKDKRLAMQVEDHPVDYGSFEGEIPKGNYGAGVVNIFDKGNYEMMDAENEKQFLANLKKGSIKFKLSGKILKGEFALVRMKQDDNAWLLIKHKDRYAVEKTYNSEDFVAQKIKKAGVDFKKDKATKKAAPKKSAKEPSKSPTKKISKIKIEIPKPMLAKLSENLPVGEEWVYEKKYDGFRIISLKRGDEVKLFSRNGKVLNDLFPSVVTDMQTFSRDVVLDGEVVIEDKDGRSNFQLVASGEPVPPKLFLHYYVFDFLQMDNEDITQYPLSERRELLDLLFKKNKKLKVIKPVEKVVATAGMMKKVENLNWEGVIAKDINGSYADGKRSGAWLKIKLRKSQEAVICGYTKPNAGRKYFGSIVLGVFENSKLRYIGNCGSGFTDEKLKALHAKFKPLEVKTKPFAKTETITKEKDVTWLKPELVCEVYYSEWTNTERLRHPVFKGVRTDKSPREARPETIAIVGDEVVKIGTKQVALTNLNKVYWPKEKIIKGQLIAYYDEMADWILPYIKNKPISLHRFPNGINGSSFFQKDFNQNGPDWLKTVPVHSESNQKEINYIICNDKATLLYIANLGSIEINPWLSDYKKPEHPEFAVLDLDPNGADFTEVVAVAQTTHELLDSIDVSSFIKTSGSTGLHIYINVNRKYDYDKVRDFIELIAQMVHEQHPDTTSLVRDPKKRKGLIYMDFLQNRRGQTIAAPYSVRPKPFASVSTPLHWDEVNDDLKISDHTIKNVIKRIEDVEDPWKEIFQSTVDIKKALSKL